MKTIKYDDIKTAKTVDEFRENLKKVKDTLRGSRFTKTET